MEASDAHVRGQRATLLGLFTNTALALIKLSAGVIGHSYALVADAVESTTDIFASFIVWRGLRVSSRAPDQRHPFGYGKAESIAAAAVAVMLLAAALGISVQAIREILTPHHSPAPFTLAVLAAVVVTKELLFRYAFTVGEQVRSRAVQTDAWHHRSDAITSAAAFVGISVALIGGPRWASADDWAALAASLIIAANGLRLLRPALLDLMDAAPDEMLLADIELIALQVEGVLAVEKVLARRTGMHVRVVIHVHADPETSLIRAHELGGKVRSTLRARIPAIADVVVHMEPAAGGFARDRAGHTG